MTLITSLNEKPEAELVGDARNGNREAAAGLFRRHCPHSATVARRLLPAQDVFLDAVQSAYHSAFQNFQSVRADASFSTWITRIVLNQCLMRLRDPRLDPDDRILQAWRVHIGELGSAYTSVPTADVKVRCWIQPRALRSSIGRKMLRPKKTCRALDLLLMTANKPKLDAGQDPTTNQIASAWRDDSVSNDRYFYNNRHHGITNVRGRCDSSGSAWRAAWPGADGAVTWSTAV